jgi:hypothetical protein
MQVVAEHKLERASCHCAIFCHTIFIDTADARRYYGERARRKFSAASFYDSIFERATIGRAKFRYYRRRAARPARNPAARFPDVQRSARHGPSGLREIFRRLAFGIQRDARISFLHERVF